MFDLLNDVDAQDLRDVQERNMPHTCVVYDLTEVLGPGGRPTLTRALAYTGKCRLAPLGEIEKEHALAGAIEASTSYRVIFPLGTPLAKTQEIDATGVTRTSSGDVAFAMTLDVIGVEPPHAAIELSSKVLATRRV